MKKRLLSCLALLLLAAMLLCSCAEGLPLSELYFASKDAVSGYVTQLKLLQAGSKTIVADRTSEYEISLVQASSKEVRESVNALAARIKELTGADLTDKKREGVTKRILIGLPAQDATAKVCSAAQFFIGFSGEDLIIQAQNEIMLASAIRYFMQNYLPSEPGDMILSPDLAYYSPVATYLSKEHALFCAEQAGNVASQAAKDLCNTLLEQTGVRFDLKSDFNESASATDILFGAPNDREAQKILATLSFDDFYIGVREGRLMILAHTGPALQKATELFLSAFVTGNAADFDRENKTVSLPGVCDYTFRGEGILLADQGVSHAVLVYPDNVSSTALQAIQSFAVLYEQLTNASLRTYKESEYQKEDGTFEILVGDTCLKYPQLSYLNGITRGKWTTAVLPEIHALAVYAKGDFAILAALNELGKAFAAQVAAISKVSIYERGNKVITGVERMLYLPADFNKGEQEPPDLSVPFTVTIRYSYYQIVAQAELSQYRYNSFLRSLRNAGFVQFSNQTQGDTVILVYTSGTRTVRVTYDTATKLIELRVSPGSPR